MSIETRLRNLERSVLSGEQLRQQSEEVRAKQEEIQKRIRFSNWILQHRPDIIEALRLASFECAGDPKETKRMKTMDKAELQARANRLLTDALREFQEQDSQTGTTDRT